MNFNEINPYIRFAMARDLTEDYSRELAAYDFRMFYGLSGKIRIEVDGACFSVTKNTFVLIPPGHFYRLCTEEEGKEPNRFGILNFDMTCDRADQKLSIPPHPADRFNPALIISDITPEEFASPCVFESDYRSTEFFRDILTQFLHKPPLYREECGARLKFILTLALRSTIKKQHDRPRVVEEILDFVRTNYNMPLTNALIAEHFVYHPNYVNRVFKASMGQSLHQYIIHYRLKVAKTLLTGTDYSIDEIAHSVGFESPSYFSKYFKEYFGEPPLTFRASYVKHLQ